MGTGMPGPQHLGRICMRSAVHVDIDRWASAIVPAASAGLDGLQAAASHAFALVYPSAVGDTTGGGSWPVAGHGGAVGAAASLLATSPQQLALRASMRTPMRMHGAGQPATGEAQNAAAASEYFFVEPRPRAVECLQSAHGLRELQEPETAGTIAPPPDA